MLGQADTKAARDASMSFFADTNVLVRASISNELNHLGGSIAAGGAVALCRRHA